MQWNWNDDVCGELFRVTPDDPKKIVRGQTAERGQFFVFEQEDCAGHLWRIDRKAARECKIVEAPAAQATKWLGGGFAHNGRDEGAAAMRAHGAGNRTQRG
jgi:hypothetical protein